MKPCPSCSFGNQPIYSYDDYSSEHGFDETFYRFMIITKGTNMSIHEISTIEGYYDLGREALLFGHLIANYLDNKMFCRGCMHTLKTLLKKRKINNDNDALIIICQLLTERLKADIRKNRKIKNALNRI